MVTLLELKFPHRAEWRPPVSEVKTDLGFMTIVQLAFPPLMGFVFTYALIEPARALNLPISALWPHGWPIWVQALLMILTVDFLRYWLHRAAHQNDTLWRLHSVHHSVEQMYWLNTARFHLIEKAMQMTLDSLPFLLMAVDPTVLALYYVAYATNGFFQHCNIELRYGFLNYIVGSAETHRWHHSRIPRESNANYGNTVIVWDLLFGTWFLPRERSVQRARPSRSRIPEVVLGADARAVHPLKPDVGNRVPRWDGGVRGAVLASRHAQCRGGRSEHRRTFCGRSFPQTRPRSSASSIGFADIRTPEDFRRASGGSGLREAARLHRTSAAYRRTGTHGGTALVLCADERFYGEAEIHSRLRIGAPPISRRAGTIHLPAVSSVPRRVFRQGAGHHGRRRGGRGSTPVTTSAPSPDICTNRCPPPCNPGSWCRPGCRRSPTTISSTW